MYKQLTSNQRYAIYLGLKRKWTLTAIAVDIGVSVSTVSREVRRNSKPDGEYTHLHAQARRDFRRHGLQGNHRKSDQLWFAVEEKLRQDDWSPAQIAGVLRLQGVRLCKQTIYNHVHSDPLGELAKHLPHRLKYTRRQKARHVTKATNIANRTSIHDRPKEADGRRFGDWEMDTIVDHNGNAILTLTERSTNFLLIDKLKDGRKADSTAKAVIRLLYPYRKWIKTITTDNGCEFADHLKISDALSLKGHDRIIVYFTDSYSSWQKGAIENANKLIRRYIPKGTDLKNISNIKLKRIQHTLNARPREKLHFNSPKFCFFKSLT